MYTHAARRKIASCGSPTEREGGEQNIEHRDAFCPLDSLAFDRKVYFCDGVPFAGAHSQRFLWLQVL